MSGSSVGQAIDPITAREERRKRREEERAAAELASQLEHINQLTAEGNLNTPATKGEL